jgi:signal transduction histidine kinase
MARWGAIGISAAFLLLAMLDTATAETKRVLILHSFGRDFRPWSEYSRAIREELQRQSPWPLDLHEHSLVTARSSDENAEVAFVDYLRALYAKNPPDLIVSIGAPAAAFVQRHRQQAFPGTPMVLAVVDQRRVQYSVLTENDTVVAVAIDYRAAIENILQVLPNTQRVTVVVGTSPIEKFWKEAIGKEVAPLAGRIAFTWTDDLSFEDLLRHAAALPPHSAIFWELMIVDAAGVVHEEDKALARLHTVANAPIFSYTDAFFGREIVGGPHVPVLEYSQRLGEVAARILGGEKASDIKTPPVGMARQKFDWRELRRWGISESRLPHGSDVLFRSPTLWEQYRLLVLGVGTILLLQSALIAWLLYEQQRRRRSEAAAHELSGRLISAQEEERARLARELHDDVTQRLAALALDAGREEHNLPNSAGGTAMRSMREGLARLSSDVHALSYRLHPSILRDLGLRSALISECEHFGQTSSVRIDLHADEVPEQVPPDVALCLFRIAQESLRNIARHASASRAGIRLLRLNDGLQLTVRDNGLGFDPNHHRARASLGLASMRQRVALLGGKLNIESEPLGGTTISAWVPIRQAPAEQLAAAAG